jgi:hypothetical protein
MGDLIDVADRRIKAALLALLEEEGVVEARPSKLRPTPHVRIDVEVDAEGTVTVAKSIPRKIRIEPEVLAAVDRVLPRFLGSKVEGAPEGYGRVYVGLRVR